MNKYDKRFRRWISRNWIKIGIGILCLVPNVCFLFGIRWAILQSAQATEANVFSMIAALVSLNIAVTFFIPILITYNQITDIAKKIVDQKFLKERMERYATQENISDILERVSTLLFWQKRYIWALSCSLNALNEYIQIALDKQNNPDNPNNTDDPNNPRKRIYNLWMTIEAMVNIILNKHSGLLEDEFPISNKEIKFMEKQADKDKDAYTKIIKSKQKQLAKDKKKMLMRFYVEIFELMFQKEGLIYILGNAGGDQKQVQNCLNIKFREIIIITADKCNIELETIRSEIEKSSYRFENAETRSAAKEILKNFI
jgi:hypothetical protein